MISALVNLLLPLTVLLSLMLLIRKPLRKSIDANTVYNLWLVIPLSLVLYSLPFPWQHLSWLNISELTAIESQYGLMQRYLVTPSQSINQHLSIDKLLGLWLSSTWALGFTLLISYWAITQFNYRKALKLEFLADNKHQQQITESGITKLVLAQSSHIHSPMLIGLFKQVLVIPEDFETLYTPEQQQLIISHEMCHFSQHHMWTNQLALMLLALFWFNPLAWRAYAAFRQDQEHSCDQVVLARKHTQSRIQYCKALVLAAETAPPNAFTLLSFMNSFKQNGEQHFMFNRIEQIKQMSKGFSTKSTITKVAKLSLVTLISSSLLAGVSYAGHQLHQDEGSKVTTKKVVLGLSPTHRIEPKYPIAAAKAGTEGSVVLKFDVEADGSVSHVEVVIAKPAYVFDKSAVTALKQWKYKESDKINKNLLVQLDYLMGPSSEKLESLIERIEVSH
ncbi:TonB family protein [Colwellia psychrerythraea]|uniref:Protein TonB n=1 Tax=Colwellia psychrerythraea TaxID=28229 RepID=A0A099KJ12_COLPS|nr:M56 family metallopeptidase [Colwellia psychrerythraea]KGJ90396.1 TonB family protein [Colwellia psychrerythraea]